MSLSVVIADSSVPLAVSLAANLSGGGHRVALLSGGAVGPSVPDGIQSISWNRPSLLSARTVPVAAGNLLGGLDCAVLAFDYAAFAALPENADASTQERAAIASPGIVDSFVNGYVHLAGELSSRFARAGKGRIAFVLRDREARGAQEGAPSIPRNLPLSVAEAAFERLAEETALACERYPVRVSLVRIGEGDDAEGAQWLAALIAADQPSRGPARWVKAGRGGIFAKFQ